MSLLISMLSSELNIVPEGYHVGYNSDWYHTKFSLDSMTTGVGQQANEISGHEFYVAKDTTFYSIGVHQSVAAAESSVGRIGIYSMGADGTAETLVAQTGTLALDTIGFIEGIINTKLVQGMYWLAMISDSITNVNGWSFDDALYYGASLSSSNPTKSGFKMDYTYADGLPASFTPWGVSVHIAIQLTVA